MQWNVFRIRRGASGMARKVEPTRSSVPNEIKRGGPRRTVLAQVAEAPRDCPKCDAPMVSHSFLSPRLHACPLSECFWMTCPSCSRTVNLRTRESIVAGWTQAIFLELDWDESNTQPQDEPGAE